MDLIGQSNWDAFNALISTDAQDTFFTQDIIWRRVTSRVDPFGEDAQTTADITLKCLINYNDRRTWPITKITEAGETDEQSMQVLFTKKYLRDAGYLNASDYFIYDPGRDKFIVDGLLMKPMGDSSISQSSGGALLIEVILVRQPGVTGNIR